VPESLLESELFGYEKGAFTGADRRKPGLFELAAGGTLFLDEVGDMPPHLQVKLLRVLQDRKIQRLGGTAPIPIDVRIIAATNRDLDAAVRDGTFREDLFYRLNVIRLELPPLRDRPADIAALAGRFVKEISSRVGKAVNAVSPDALRLLSSYGFPGNIRELQNLIERAVILSEGRVLEPRDFAIQPQERRVQTPKPGTLRELEREAIVAALHRREGKRQVAAEDLGISRRTLLNKIKEYGIQGF
jgi:two-component system response regulator AtoC